MAKCVKLVSDQQQHQHFHKFKVLPALRNVGGLRQFLVIPRPDRLPDKMETQVMSPVSGKLGTQCQLFAASDQAGVGWRLEAGGRHDQALSVLEAGNGLPARRSKGMMENNWCTSNI